MRKTRLILAIIIGMSFSACSTTAKEPVKDSVVISDIKESLATQDGFVDYQSEAITDKAFEGTTYTVKAEVEYYRYDAMVTAEMTLEYNKVESIWVGTIADTSVISARAFRAPELPAHLDDFVSPYLNKFYKTYFTDSNYGLGFDNLDDTELNFTSNKVVFTIKTNRLVIGLLSASAELMLEATYHYPDGWTYEETFLKYSEQVLWEGRYLVELGDWVGETFITTDSFEMNFYSNILLDATADGENINGDAYVQFTFEGEDYDLKGEPTFYDDDRTNIKRLSISYGMGQYDDFVIAQVEEWQNNEIVPVLKIWHGGKLQKITKLES